MSFDAFEAEVENQESSGGGTIFTDIAKVRVFFCWQGYSNNLPKMFEYVLGNDDSKKEVRTECQKYCDTDTQSRYKNFPQEGICVQIFGNDIPTHKDGNFYWGDSFSFASCYEREGNINELTNEEKASINGPMPYNLAIESIRSNRVLTDWKPHWVKITQEINQWQKAKGKTNKNGFPKRLYIVQQVYENEAEAKAEAEAINGGAGQGVSQNNTADIQLSDRALEVWGEGGALSKTEILSAMRTQKTKIENFIGNALNGLGMEKMSLPAAQVFNLCFLCSHCT